MRRPDGGVVRFAEWIACASAVSLLLYFPIFQAFFGLLNGELDQNFGTAFPAIPVAALLGVLFLLRWSDLHKALLGEEGYTSLPYTRMLGLALMVGPLLFISYSVTSLPASAVTLILVFYGSALLINPSTMRILLPYAVLYLVGVSAPFILEYYAGEPFASLATYITQGMVRVSGIPVTWQGNTFQFVSRVGGQITSTVSPGCSSILSITTFLGLLGLMHFDMRKPVPSTVKLAVVGVVSLVLLNSVRIYLLIWAGYSSGAAVLWSLHNWVGYAIFVGFYLAFLVAYTRMDGGGIQPGRTAPVAPSPSTL